MSNSSPVHTNDLLADDFRLFETEVRPSRALTFINWTFFGAGAMVSTAVTFFWLNSLLVLGDDGEFELIEPLFSLSVLMLVFLLASAALIGAGVYVSRNSTGLSTSDGGDRQSAAMPTRGQAIKSNPLAHIRVAAPCTVEWELMTGDDRVRFCDQCNRNVFNLSAMSRRQAEDLIYRTEGRLCVRFYRRQDGTVLTDDCPTGLRALREKYRRLRTHTIGAVLSFCTFVGIVGAGKLADSEQEILREPPARLEKVVELSSKLKVPPPYELVTGKLDYSPLWHAKPLLIRRSEGIIREKAIIKATPQLPSFPEISGTVVVRIIISQNGKVESAEAISGPTELKDSAVEAARRWTFAPWFIDGPPVKVESILTFHFGQ